MSGRLIGISVFALVIAAGPLLSAERGTPGDSPSPPPNAVRLAVDNMGEGGSMRMIDDKTRMQTQGQSGQTGQPGQSGAPMGHDSQGQTGGVGSMQPQGSTGPGGAQMGPGGMMMNDNMRMQPGQSGSGQGMQSHDSMGQRSMGQGGSMGGPGGMPGMMENMMRMMNDNMRTRSIPGMAMGSGQIDFTDRIEGRIAFIRAELRITDAQAQTWDSFALAVRSSRQHLIEARQLVNEPYASSAERLDRYERHLTQRLEALKTARAAFNKLYTMLDDGQKRTADELVVPFIATF